nr:hypothetical protein pC5.8b_380 [Rhizobium rhizogenes]
MVKRQMYRRTKIDLLQVRLVGRPRSDVIETASTPKLHAGTQLAVQPPGKPKLFVNHKHGFETCNCSLGCVE